MATDSISSEIEKLRAEIAALSGARERELGYFKSAIETAYANAAAQLDIKSRELAAQVQDDFYKRVQRTIWIIGTVAVIATFGGVITLKDVVKTIVEDQVEKKADDIKKLTSAALEDVVKLRSDTQIAVQDSKRTATESQQEVKTLLASTKADVAAKSREMDAAIDKARKVIGDAVAWWEASKLIVDKVKSKPQPQPQAEKPSRDNDPVFGLMKCLQSAGVNDADVDLFIAVFTSDEELAKNAMQRGANPVARPLDVARRHKDAIAKHCPGLIAGDL
jgi:hypothetical protein